jgi:alanine racemase
MHDLNSRAWVEVDLGALLRNASSYAMRAGVPLLPMVKADAYGLGAVPVAKALERLSPWGFGVATIDEGRALRAAGITRPIVVFTPLLPDDLAFAAEAHLTPALGRAETIVRWSPTGLPWHLAVDTGMSRAGVQWNEIDSIVDIVAESPPQGALTHFHSSATGTGAMAVQEERFVQAIGRLRARPSILHVDNSAAVQRRGKTPWTMARPGIFLYGASKVRDSDLSPEPVVAVRARIVDLRTIEDRESVGYGASYRATGRRRIATLGLGYADGYRRSLGNRGVVLVKGRRVPVVGTVTMDMTMLDVTDVRCEVGDTATLIGDDDSERITVEDVAALAELSPYEILVGLAMRMPRLYTGLGEGA